MNCVFYKTKQKRTNYQINAHFWKFQPKDALGKERGTSVLVPSAMHLFNKPFLSIFSVLDTVLGFRHVAVVSPNPQASCYHGAHGEEEGTDRNSQVTQIQSCAAF
jgi:hypothetical protein